MNDVALPAAPAANDNHISLAQWAAVDAYKAEIDARIRAEQAAAAAGAFDW